MTNKLLFRKQVAKSFIFHRYYFDEVFFSYNIIYEVICYYVVILFSCFMFR